ncbi:Integrator complex subunit 13 [Chionoecetes opilio]|uniref:Integrator complex subunit 13 n=1 Tax=Chionoecetes opilio TaxID=41210 RepID=A0A8J5CLT9_CHIOP|nr:Integrator complex subunit 13 [Chionoecetes opilio]
MTFPTSHKTVFVMDHTMTASSGVKLEMDSFSKCRSGSNGGGGAGGGAGQLQPMNLIPLRPVTKSLWTCAVEAITEYCSSGAKLADDVTERRQTASHSLPLPRRTHLLHTFIVAV